MFENIPQSKNWIRIAPVNKGYSVDRKYHVWDSDGKEYLLRVSPIGLYENKQQIFANLKQLAERDVPASRPVEIGKLDAENMYLLLTWLPGIDAEEYLQNVDEETAYNLGIQGGQILRRIQSVEIPPQKESWSVAYQRMVDERIQETETCPYELPKRELLTKYMLAHRNLIQDCPTVFMHGDYHVGNMIVDGDGKLGIVDFDRAKTAHPYREFKCFQWNVLASPYFASGLLDGYFDGEIPADFFPILALFAAEGLVHYVNWSAPYGEAELALAIENYKKQMLWFDDFQRVVPSWYVGKGLKDFQ